ncbi:uncharacterized protein LOC112575750 isoform X1 [Pomacea canaliculata]|uniref:uncharacterized protein LOC112575750 isoform X1 n=1 Tax=Pomacea canaliculata TaxID=400727 RepID=UPI000D72E6DB|nr:uncharacterized protein LOC112575750 isoform X1 [Pomacea canaliculata]
MNNNHRLFVVLIVGTVLLLLVFSVLTSNMSTGLLHFGEPRKFFSMVWSRGGERNDSIAAQDNDTTTTPSHVKTVFKMATAWLNISAVPHLRLEAPPTEIGSPRWQRLDNGSEALVYAAHYDDVEDLPVIRIVGIARVPLPYENVTCLYFGERGLDDFRFRDQGRLYHFRGKNGRKYIGSFVDCPLRKGDNDRPFAVSVTKGNDSILENYLPIHYSCEESCTNITQGSTHSSNDRKVQRSSEKLPRWNITRCFPAFFGKFDDQKHLVEMAAASLVLGVDKFVFYVESVGPNVSAALRALQKLGVAEVLPWNMHWRDPVVYYMAQFSAIQDCLYRHLHSSRFLLFGDVDEVFVPRNESSLLPLIQQYFAAKPECGAFLFLNTFYYLTLATAAPPTNRSDIVKDIWRRHMDMLQHTNREVKIFGPRSRSKPAVDPSRVEVGSVHANEKYRGKFKECTMDKKDALLHHYRAQLAQKQEVTTNDPTLWRFAEDIIRMTDTITRTISEIV